MKKLFALGLLIICTASHADWKLATVFGKDAPVGYIYYTSAIGTVTGIKKDRVATRLQFICSLKGGEPIVSIFWDKGLDVVTDVAVSHVVDNSPIDFSVWTSDGELIYKPISASTTTIQSIKSGRVVKFQMQGTNNTHYQTAFNISGINFTDFNAKCGTQL